MFEAVAIFVAVVTSAYMFPNTGTFILLGSVGSSILISVCTSVMFGFTQSGETKELTQKLYALETAVDTMAYRLEKSSAQNINPGSVELALSKINDALNAIQHVSSQMEKDTNEKTMGHIHELKQHMDNVQGFLEHCIDHETAARKRTNMYIYKHFYEILRDQYRRGNTPTAELNDKFRELNQAFGY